jgi:hypothetical protein
MQEQTRTASIASATIPAYLRSHKHGATACRVYWIADGFGNFPIKRSQMSQCFCGVRAQQAERFPVTAKLL